MPKPLATTFVRGCSRLINAVHSLQRIATPMQYARLGDVANRIANAGGLRMAGKRSPKHKRTRKAKTEQAAK